MLHLQTSSGHTAVIIHSKFFSARVAVSISGSLLSLCLFIYLPWSFGEAFPGIAKNSDAFSVISAGRQAITTLRSPILAENISIHVSLINSWKDWMFFIKQLCSSSSSSSSKLGVYPPNRIVAAGELLGGFGDGFLPSVGNLCLDLHKIKKQGRGMAG